MSNQRLKALVGLTGWVVAGVVCFYVVWVSFLSGDAAGSASPSSDGLLAAANDTPIAAGDGDLERGRPDPTRPGDSQDVNDSEARPGKKAAATFPAPDPDAKQTITEEQRKYLWDIEQHGNRLSKDGFKLIAKALLDVDRQALAAKLAPDFKGAELGQPEELVFDAEFAKVIRRRDAGMPPVELDREQFLDMLLEYRSNLGREGEEGLRAPKAKLSLMALAPTKRGDLDSIWRGTCQLRIWGESAPGEPAEVLLYLQYELDRPTKANLARGGWLRSCSITQSQVGKSPRYLLPDVAKDRGIDADHYHDNWKDLKAMPISMTGGVYLNDYNRNGILDMLITEVNGLIFYQGTGDGGFVDITSKCGITANDPHQNVAAFIDIDGDGWEDLLIGEDVYRNDKGRKFVNHTSYSNLRMTPGLGGMVVADYDRDGRMDVYATVAANGKADSWIEGKNGLPEANQLWRNVGNWQFENVTNETGTSGGNRSTFTAAWLDANNDGWPDLHVINEFGNGVLLVNHGINLFSEKLLVDGPGDFGSMGLAAGDYDNDGNIDLFVGNMYSKAGNRVIGNLAPDSYTPEIMAAMQAFVVGSQLHRNTGDLSFQRMAGKYQIADIGWSYGPQFIDLDNDGWLDLHATCGFISRDPEKPDG